MNINQQTFQYESLMYIINKIDTEIIIQIIKNNQVDAKQMFSITQLQDISCFFYFSSSIQSVYYNVVSIAKEGKIVIKENSEYYSFVLSINFKDISTVELAIPKLMTIPMTVDDQPSMKAINAQFDQLNSLIETKHELLQIKSNKQFEIFNSLQYQSNKQNEIINSLQNQFNQYEDTINAKFASVEHNFKLLHQEIFEYKKQQTLQPKIYNKLKISNYNFEIIKQLHKQDVVQMDQFLLSNDKIGFLTKEEAKMLSDCFDKDKPIKWKPLYNPFKGQDTCQQCFDLCYNLPSVVLLIETVNGFKFGAYTSVGWDTPPSDGSSNI